MPKAWAILAVSLVVLVLFESLSSHGVLRTALRNPEFLQPLQVPAAVAVPTAWPTPQALPPHPGKLQTRPLQVHDLLLPGSHSLKHPLHVAYFADSIIEGDLISGTLRDKIQSRFGGQGVGWVGIAPIDAWAREDIQQTYGDNWDRRALFRVGWQGQAFGPGSAAWHVVPGSGAAKIHFVAAGRSHGVRLPAATLWYGSLSGTAVTVDASADGQSLSIPLPDHGLLNHVALSTGPAGQLDLSVASGPNPAFFGVSFDQGSGVDNFSTRGSHGGPLQRLDVAMLKSLQSERHYGLVLVHYGINALQEDDDPQFRWYRRELDAALQRLQAGLPGAAIVLISATDRAVHEGDGWVSHPDLPGLLAAQAAAADDVGIPFINAFDLMGGPGSMKAWAESTPRLAEHDYVHLSPLGAKRFAEALWLSLQKGGAGRAARKPAVAAQAKAAGKAGLKPKAKAKPAKTKPAAKVVAP
jgi:lysophospholipase L1-like esterase